MKEEEDEEEDERMREKKGRKIGKIKVEERSGGKRRRNKA